MVMSAMRPLLSRWLGVEHLNNRQFSAPVGYLIRSVHNGCSWSTIWQKVPSVLGAGETLGATHHHHRVTPAIGLHAKRVHHRPHLCHLHLHEVGRHGVRVMRVGACVSAIAETKVCIKINIYNDRWNFWAYCDSRSTVPGCRCAELDLLAESLPRHSQQEADHS